MSWLRRYISLSLMLVIGFMAFVLFFNDNSMMAGMEYATQVRDLKQQIARCEDTPASLPRPEHASRHRSCRAEKIVREALPHAASERRRLYIRMTIISA